MGGGKSSGSSGSASSKYTDALAQMAQSYWGQTDPTRQQFYTAFDQAMSGQAPIYLSNQFSGMRSPIEEQYNVARQNVLGSTPKGGALTDALTNVETERAQSLGELWTSLYTDMINKAYGSAFGAPQTSESGLSGAANAATSKYAADKSSESSLFGSVSSSICCFNFLEAEGEIYHTVRMYRDAHYSKTGPVGKGYYLTAKYLVPLMAHYKYFKILVRIAMTRPLKGYSQWAYGENRWGFVLWPCKAIWVGLWKIMGSVLGGK